MLKSAIKARNDNDFAISVACKVTSSDGRFLHMSEEKVMKPKETLSFKRCEAAADVQVDWFWEPCKTTPLPPVVKEIELDGIQLIRTTCAGRNDSKCRLRYSVLHIIGRGWHGALAMHTDAASVPCSF